MNFGIYLVCLGALSLVTFILYGVDKSLSRRKGPRIPEKTFHILTLLGGFAGGWAGRYVFRHKTKKGVFTLVLVVATVIHAVVIWAVWGR
jgi:uncharacterized membrane protein YsdA (DUF1294 family)